MIEEDRLSYENIQTPFVKFGDDKNIAARRDIHYYGTFISVQYALLVQIEEGDSAVYAELLSAIGDTIEYPDFQQHPENYDLARDDLEVVAAFETVLTEMKRSAIAIGG